jgi:hypothetical protein
MLKTVSTWLRFAVSAAKRLGQCLAARELLVERLRLPEVPRVRLDLVQRRRAALPRGLFYIEV